MEGNMHYGESRPKRRYKWWKLLLIGVLTYILGIGVLAITQNPNLFPSVVMLGNFLIPVTYVAFFYERRTLSNIRMADTVGSFFYGGFIGTFSAAILEPIFIHMHSLNFRAAMLVGIIEEFAKLLGVVAIVSHRRHRLQLDGIILGAAAGMGFAALESSGYAFTTFLKSGGNLSETVYITLLRGIFSPLGHGTWTAILSGILLKESTEGNFRININVLGAYCTVALLHGAWDAAPAVISLFVSSTAAVLIAEVIIGLAGILILWGLWRQALEEARREKVSV